VALGGGGRAATFEAESGVPAQHSAVASDGSSLMYSPALQPMPRFMGAGPVANGSLVRARPKAEPSDKWTAVGTV
jgi:hypothetical protein